MEIVKPTGRKLLGRPRRRWEDNIRIDLIYIYILSKREFVLIRLRIWIIRDPSECGIEPPGSTSHGVSWSVRGRVPDLQS